MQVLRPITVWKGIRVIVEGRASAPPCHVYMTRSCWIGCRKWMALEDDMLEGRGSPACPEPGLGLPVVTWQAEHEDASDVSSEHDLRPGITQIKKEGSA